MLIKVGSTWLDPSQVVAISGGGDSTVRILFISGESIYDPIPITSISDDKCDEYANLINNTGQSFGAVSDENT